MKKIYFAEYTNDFANTYNVYHAPAGFQPPESWNWERITRREAEQLVRAERYRRIHDQAFSGFASAYILPHDLGADEDVEDYRRFDIDGLFVTRR